MLPLPKGVRERVATKHHIGTGALALQKAQPPVENLRLNSPDELRRLITGAVKTGDTKRARKLLAELKRRNALSSYNSAGKLRTANLSRAET